MSAFSDAIAAHLDATRDSDRDIICAATIEIRFLSKTVRLWNGVGSMITEDGNRWVGWRNGDPDNPQSFISIPTIQDPRSGNAPTYEFEIGYLDADSYTLLKSSEEETAGRTMLIGNVYLEGGSTRAKMNPGNVTRLKLLGGASFSEKRQKMPDGSHKLLYKAGIKAQNINGGRSRVSFSTFTDSGQKFRSKALFAIENDLYAQFVVRYAGGITLTI